MSNNHLDQLTNIGKIESEHYRMVFRLYWQSLVIYRYNLIAFLIVINDTISQHYSIIYLIVNNR